MNTAARKIAGIGMMPALPAPSSVPLLFLTEKKYP